MLIDRVCILCICVDYLNIVENVVKALKLASILATLQVLVVEDGANVSPQGN